MRNVIFAINITVHGCSDHNKTIVERASSGPNEGNEDIYEYYTHLMRDVDRLVPGRNTYQWVVPGWPDVANNHPMTKPANEFAQTFDSMKKIVFSQSLASAEGKKRELFARTFQTKCFN
jgi:hypothetical protein